MINFNKILVTGGAGFIGSCLVRHLINETESIVVNVDKLTYAGNLSSLRQVMNNPRHIFVKNDIGDFDLMRQLFEEHKPDAVMHLAAESHVDRSIKDASEFIQTNYVGTFNMLEGARKYWSNLESSKKSKFRFHHVSTDEVYGSLEENEYFTETSPYRPNSAYAATKAGSDHLVRAWHHTYGLPIVISNCSNNYGPYQYPEKLIPHTILCALKGQSIPVYGNGLQIRDWIYVEDHVDALVAVVNTGEPGESYSVGCKNEVKNIDLVELICVLLDELVPENMKPNGLTKFSDLIQFVEDRPGHDKRYAIDPSKIQEKIKWRSKESFTSGLKKTIQWYIDNNKWWQAILNKEFELNRIGLIRDGSV